MNRREMLGTLVAGCFSGAAVGAISKSDATPKLHLFEVSYSPLDAPQVYASQSAERALAAYHEEVRGHVPVNELPTLDDVVQVPDDVIYRYGEEDENGHMIKVDNETAGEIAADAPEDVCIFCDPHYC